MSGQENKSLFDRYSKRQTADEADEQKHLASVPSDGAPDDEPNEGVAPDSDMDEAAKDVVQGGVYKASFKFKSKARQRLRLHYGNGIRVKVLSYAYLIEIVSTSHQWLTLVFSSTIVTLKGRHLDQLIESIQDEQVRALVCFRPGIHPEPATGEPCILEIEEQSLNQFVSEMVG